MQKNSSSPFKHYSSQSQIKKLPLKSENNGFNQLFFNTKIVLRKKNMVEFVNPKVGQNKKFSNIKAYDSIPLLNNFKRYFSVQVVRQCKNNKYDLIFKTDPMKIKDKILSKNIKSKILVSNIKSQTQIQTQVNCTSYKSQDEQNRIKSSQKRTCRISRQNEKKSQSTKDVKISLLIDKKLSSKQNQLAVSGKEIMYNNLWSPRDHTSSITRRTISQLVSCGKKYQTLRQSTKASFNCL